MKRLIIFWTIWVLISAGLFLTGLGHSSPMEFAAALDKVELGPFAVTEWATITFGLDVCMTTFFGSRLLELKFKRRGEHGDRLLGGFMVVIEVYSILLAGVWTLGVGGFLP